jgi:hypothetical protein
MRRDPLRRLQLRHQRVQRQIALLRQARPHPVRNCGQLAATRVALTLRRKPACLAPQLDHVVHKPGRDPEMTRRLPMAVAFIDKRNDPLTQLNRMWLTHLYPPYLTQKNGITNQAKWES